MSAGVLVFIIVVLVVMYAGIQWDNAHRKREREKTWTQKGREKYKEEKRTRK